MIAAKIKEGQRYAFTTDPHKGVDDLSTLSAEFCDVKSKGELRWTAEGFPRYDGILVTDDYDRSHVLKARDILMPWKEYTARRDERARAEAAAREAREQRQASLMARNKALVKIL